MSEVTKTAAGSDGPGLSGRSILVTGGTGSFGRRFVSEVFRRWPDVARMVIYSRDELKQSEMAEQFPVDEYPAIRFFIGNVRDKDRLQRAMEGIDTVIHAAAMKQVPAAEYNPFEAVKTNVLGAQNVIEAALDTRVKNVVALSTDKAAAPINLYGATKLCSDKLFIAANNLKGHRDIRFSVVRYGNVMGSRGSVIPFFLKRRSTGVLPITDPNMTRFNISLDEGVNMVLYTLENSIGGEILVPKIPSYRITDLAEAIGPECEKPIVGIRPGEKLHEEMVTASDSQNTIENDRYYVIVPMLHRRKHNETIATFAEHHDATQVEHNFLYSSESNDQWLNVDELRQLIKQHVDANFTAS
ncbi:polysaccharide biosynthesis protein CapD [Rhodopirellula maiorica SM1]|uniref:Polysaccharide biosynthesis protein CapD n=1 Tax=Rhodopirellula maiorica SM1 TaxID=1265738 RepID=M5R7R5_9BACT|nr:UDP-N-acetylglucosamine 4,6-dehydratase (inverting) [Rhodopirellula maiorica]EMI15425.1 polysaccharide biosynthesis protein CapD [Rhodopirellula maiorica SM1]